MSKILGSSRVWAAFLAIVFVLLAFYLPVFTSKLDQVAITSAVIAFVLFIVAETVAGAGKGWAIFKQFKFWALLISLVFIFIRAFVPGFPVTEDLIQIFIAAIGSTSVSLAYRPIGETLKKR